MAGAGGLGWPDPAVLGGWNALQEARAWVGVPDPVWEVLLQKTGMFDAAVALHAQERRHGPMWSSMAALSRTATHLGVELTYMPGMESMPSVAEALRSVHALATEHGLALVALDLEIARALAESDADALVRASDAAAEMGAGLRAGRSRLDGVMLGLLPVSAVEAALGHLANAPLYTHRARAAMSDADSVAWLESHGVVHR